ncbi:hypothetical protein HELRODRAFT_181747 [Helobdella robusta]|uniref:Deoxynucleoside kinase domain-containing protein n=1 Tax=Helobdella robusta TaxID=6412 RepID=T1FHA0_HELRO|nr:hypothetical protein HELRODRAFT_181747 [Helobdella robusta]ESN92128.1 hypothetical protein HELRODRAFT_181747 [Helobdella robusta]
MFSSKIPSQLIGSAVLKNGKNFLFPISSAAINRTQVATLKATYGEKYPYAEPFPYKLKPYTTFHAYYDKALKRFNENSKIIVVEGNIAVGKSNFAKRLAAGFDMEYFGPLSDRAVFTNNDYKMDVRTLNDMLPESAKFYDLADFYKDPHPEKGTVGKLLINWYREKFFYYCEALKHLLNTGQGVVMATSVYSDAVYVNALRSVGWCTPEFVKYYRTLMNQSICELMKPHLTIYLDAPVDVIKERIQKRKIPSEVGARNLTEKYLKAIEDSYKNQFLPEFRYRLIIEELQWLKLEGEDKDDPRFEDWNRSDDDTLMEMRLFLENDIDKYHLFTMPQPWDCPEIMMKPDDQFVYDRLAEEHPVFKHRPGWSPELGHSVLFKF